MVKIIVCGAIMLTLFGCSKYELGWRGDKWGYLGLKIEGIGEHSATAITWVTGYNFSGNFIYGKTPVIWFVTNTQTYESVGFRTESSFQEYLRKNNIEFRKLIDAPPIFRIPDLSYGYHLFGVDVERTILQLEKQKGNDILWESSITKIGLIDDYVIGENKKGWFYVHMPTDKKQFAKSIDELAVILGFSKDELLRKIIDVPDYGKYKLPFKGYTIKASYRQDTRYTLYNGESYKRAVLAIEYYRRKKGYIYGKTMTDFFIFDTKNEDCAYFGQKKDDWIRELARLNLPPGGFTKVPEDKLRRLKQDPWL